MKIINRFSLLVILCFAEIYLIAQPPKAPSQPVTEIYFGKPVTDPYRNFENLQDPAVQQWMKAQTDYTRSVLNRIPGRQALIDFIKDLDNRKSELISDLVITDNDIYFYLKSTPADEMEKLYTRKGFNGEETLLFDPGGYGEDKTQKYVVRNISPTDDGSFVAFKIAPNGSESTLLMIMNVKEKKLYPEKIDRSVLAVSWLPDNSAFFYTRIGSSDIYNKERFKDNKVCLHKPGTDPSTDKEFFSVIKNPELKIKSGDMPLVIFDKGSHRLFVLVDGWSNSFYAPASELGKSTIKWDRLFTPEDEVSNVEATDNYLYVRTAKNAPNFKIIRTSLQNPDLKNADIIVPEDPVATLTSFKLTNEALYYSVFKNGVEAALYRLPNATKKAEKMNLPFAAGNIFLSTKGIFGKGGGYLARGGFTYSDIWVTITGWTSENRRYRYLPEKNKFKPEKLSADANYPELDELTVEELTVTSHDGIRVPLSLIYKKGLKRDGNNPVLLNGYGAYGASLRPGLTPSLIWTLQGGVLAIAHVRGGSELGEKWYKVGYKTTKPNTWKDLISCAEYLIANKYTSPKKIAISGGSAGGILVGRAMTERPDLFAVCMPAVGVLNTFRNEFTPNGPGNIREFGSVKDSIECMALINMDSYLNLKNGEKYPATFITAGINDPRVIAWQPAKFAARLQSVNASDKPILFFVDYEAGHGMGNTKSKSIEHLADEISFALWQTGHPDFQVK